MYTRGGARHQPLLAALLALALSGCAAMGWDRAPQAEPEQQASSTSQPDANNGKAMWIWIAPDYRDSLERDDQSYTLRRVP